MAQRPTVSIPVIALALVVAACDRKGETAPAVDARPDSASGEVAQYALMKNNIGWLTDSNIVALAGQVNSAAQQIARLQAQAWTKEPLRLVATEILRDHARAQFSLDSVATLRRIPPQAPAVAPEIIAPYDSLLATQVGLPLEEREAQFVEMMSQVHARSASDFGAMAANATDPDLRAVLASKVVLMEQAHAQRVRLIAGSLARADSVRRDSLAARDSAAARRRGGRRP